MASGELFRPDRHLSGQIDAVIVPAADRPDRPGARGMDEAPASFIYTPAKPARKHRSPDDLRNDHAAGRLSEAQLLNRMARATGLPRIHLNLTPPDPDLSGLLDPAFCLRHECLPWRMVDGCLWVATARPEDFPRVAVEIALRLEDHAVRILPVIAERDACQAHIADVHAASLVERIRSRVPISLSCRAWRADSRRRAILSLSAVAILIVLTIFYPSGIAAIGVGIALFTMAVACTMKTAAAFARLTDRAPPTRRRPIPTADLPAISILVPLFRERRIAETLVKRLQRLDYPRQKLDILLVLEEEDSLTRSLLRQTDLPAGFRVVTVPDGAPRTKPRAMNYALDFCDGEIVGVYDAEDAPDADQLLKVAQAFADAPPDVVCLQGMLDYYNPRSTWIARCFTIEYNTWFRLILPGMARLGFALPLGGTTLFFRRDRLEELGGWDAHNVTEDADLGFRLARAGYRTQVIDSTTAEEANDRILPWIKQRSRWLKGYLATYLVHMRNPVRLWRDLGPWQFLGFQAHFVTALAHFTLAPMILCFWLVTFGVDLSFTTLDTDPRIRLLTFAFLGQEALTMLLGAIATERGGHRKLWRWVPLMHLYWPLGTLAMWKALYELVFRPFYWDKTEHGHSLDPESAPLALPQPTVPIAPESSLSLVTKARDM